MAAEVTRAQDFLRHNHLKKGLKEVGDAVKHLLKAADEGADVAGAANLLSGGICAQAEGSPVVAITTN